MPSPYMSYNKQSLMPSYNSVQISHEANVTNHRKTNNFFTQYVAVKLVLCEAETLTMEV